MTSDLFYGYAEANQGAGSDASTIGLQKIFTVNSPIDRVNLLTATAEIIHALMGIPLEKSRGLVEERKKLSEKTLAHLLPLLEIATGDRAIPMYIFAHR